MATRSILIVRLLALLVLVAPRMAAAQVDCSDPDNLCTGDPCTIGSVTVASPCVADFGTRQVVVAGTLRVPSAGTLQLSGGTITVDGRIAANYSDPSSDGGNVALIAIDAVMVNGVILTMGGGSSGDIDIEAGGDVVLAAPLKASATPEAFAGAVDVQAGGFLHVAKPILVKGSTDADGGPISLSGDDGVLVEKPLNTSAGRGLSAGSGGDVTIASSAGTVTIDTKINTRGASSGYVTVSAASTLFMDGNIKVDDSSCRDCVGIAGVVTLTSTAGDVEVAGRVSARAVAFYDPTILVDAAGEAHVTGRLWAPFRADVGNGGTIVVTANLVTVEAPGNLNAASPDSGGVIRVNGGTVMLDPGTIIDAHGAGVGMGEVRIRAETGNAVLGGLVVAGGGDGTYPGVIEAVAAGNLTADGDFRCAPTGCIGMSAAGTLDTSAGSFDRPILADCPGSPSGAFVD